jgi:hypothetical protein
MSKKDEVVRLYTEVGLSTRKIAKKLNMSRSGVFHHTKGHQRSSYNNCDRTIQSQPPPQVSAWDIADMRAKNLADILHKTITKGNWPIVNHDVLMVDAIVKSGYDVKSREMVDRPAAPDAYITDILQAASIDDYKGRRFLFTRAQNSTPVNGQLLDNMEAYAKARGADIVVGAATYHPSWQAESADHSRAYDKRIEKYLCFGRLYIGPNFFFAAETNIIATAAAPIHDMISFSENKWVVIPHSKQNLVSVPTTDPKKLCSQILSTGSVTIPKVRARKAGIKSIFHHIFGFVIVEFDMEGKIFCRHVNAEKDGSFYDLNYYVQGGIVSQEFERPDYLMPADIHRGKLDLANQKDVKATFGFDGHGDFEYDNLISFLKPKRLVLQDLHDGNVDNHYIDMGQKVENAAGGLDLLEVEVRRDGVFLSRLCKMHGSYVEEVIVDESNHDLRLERYAKEHRYDNDAHNYVFGHKLALQYYEYRQECGRLRSQGIPKKRFSLHEWAIRDFYPYLNRVTWVYDGESRIINDVEVGNHGFRGTNGAKASLAGYVRIGCKISYGDKHAAGIIDGAFQAGVMTLQQGYNIGPSSWTVSHILQYANGKRTMLTMNDGAYQYLEDGRPLFSY